MATFREAREALLLSHSMDLINDEELLLLYDENTSKNRDIPYWQYGNFDLDSLSDDECLSEFRFRKNDIYSLLEVSDLPEKVRCPYGFFVHDIEAICILLKRFSYPCCYVDLSMRFGRAVPQISMVINQTMDTIYDRFNHPLSSFDQPWLSPENLERYALAVSQKGAALENCWGFIDGTVRPVYSPGNNQRVLYNGHKRVHSIKFQSVVAPNGLIANMHGPVEGRRHDSGMLASSGLLNLLQTDSHDTAGQPLCVYGDPAYPLRVHLQGPFMGANLTPMQEAFNQSMSSCFLDFRKDLKVGLSAIGKMYLVCALLRNAHTCIYGSTTSTFFAVDPPSLQQYFI